MAPPRDAIADIFGMRTPYTGDEQWPERVDERTTEAPERWVQSACVLCSNGCGLDIGVKDGGIVGVRGRAVDIANRGRLGPKGLHGWEANSSADRLLQPQIREGGRMRTASWDEAMELIVRRTRDIRDASSASAIGFYTSGQLFLEEYYTLAVLGKAGLGTPHMDGNTRLCTATAAAALKETFGCDGQPGCLADVDSADCLLMVGHNAAATDTVLWMRVLDRLAGARPPRLVVIDPRRTPAAERAWDNPRHIEELARLWNVDIHTIPHWAPPTHAMEIFHLAEIGSIRMLWIQATNPAVSLPNLARVRATLERSDLFVVVQDAFLTETARLADVVLPTALWGEKTGTFTNTDRTVHISHKAVDPPGEARPDFEIFLDFARRMDFHDKDGAPLIKWRTPGECFEAWKECSRGRPCDYTGLSYDRLSAGSGLRWPCNDANPEGAARLYGDHLFPTDPE